MNLTIIKCTASTNGGFILTLQTEGEERNVSTPFGTHPTKGDIETYYMKVNEEQAEGVTADLDLNDYSVKVRPFTKDDGITLDLKWLHHK